MKKEHIYILDILRFFAAICVVVFHYTSTEVLKGNIDNNLFESIRNYTKYGNLGVNLFFMISGFVIFASAVGRTPISFIISRIVRLYPGYWVSVSLTALSLILIGSDIVTLNLSQYFINLTMLNNYFNIDDIDGVYWTLQIELKFYFCIFLLIWLNAFDKYRYWIPVWLMLTVVFYFYQQPFFMGWFISPEYSSYFIAGVVFFLARSHGFNVLYLIMISISLCISLIYNIDRYDSMDRYVSENESLISSVIIFSFYLMFVAISLRKINVANSRLIIYMGAITYPLYLLHNVIGKAIYSYFMGIMNPLYLLSLIAIFIMFVSYLIYFYIENRYSIYLKNLLLKIFGNFYVLYSRLVCKLKGA